MINQLTLLQRCSVFLFLQLISLLCYSEKITTYELFLQQHSGDQFSVGKLRLLQATGSDTLTFQLHIDYENFQDYFLSMKEMKCLTGPELWCHIPYPYQSPASVTQGDLRWLEHRLLFMYKDPQTFGARLWNGIYYKLEFHGDEIRGNAHYVDLNQLASPPEDLNNPPVDREELLEAEPDKRWLPYLLLRPEDPGN